MNPYAFNCDASYQSDAESPQNITQKDILEARIQAVTPEKGSGGDFMAPFQDIFDR